MQDPENQPVGSTSTTPSEASPGLNFAAPRRNPVLFNQRGLRAGWRFLCWLLICFILLLGLLTLNKALRGHLPPSLARGLSQLVPALAVLGGTAVMGRLERRSLWSYGLRDLHWSSHFSFGVVIGWLALTLMLTGMHVAHHFYFGAQHMHGRAMGIAAVLNVLTFLFAVALFEETLFRGYALYTLADGMGFWPASLALSVLFATAHLSNGGEAAAGIAAVVVFGLMLSFSVWRTGSLLWALGFHFMWDYSESFLYGVPDSGIVQPDHLLSAKFVGPAWITGGTVGPEGSWFIFVVLAAIALVIHVKYPKPQFSLYESAPSGK